MLPSRFRPRRMRKTVIDYDIFLLRFQWQLTENSHGFFFFLFHHRKNNFYEKYRSVFSQTKNTAATQTQYLVGFSFKGMSAVEIEFQISTDPLSASALFLLYTLLDALFIILISVRSVFFFHFQRGNSSSESEIKGTNFHFRQNYLPKQANAVVG